MNVIRLYLNGLENLVVYFHRVKDKNKSVLFNRVPFFSHIHSDVLQKLIWSVCLIFEPIVSIVIETLLLFGYLYKAVVTKKRPLSDILYVSNGPMLKKRTISAKMYEQSVDWIYNFQISKEEKDAQKTVHSIFEYLSAFDVIVSYFQAVSATICSIKVSKLKYVMRNYSSFEYCMTYHYLRNIPHNMTIGFCNQIDKWALLYDNAPLNKILFQHGIEMPTSNWPHKMKSVDTVFVLSMEESENLFRAAFERRPSRICVMDPTITLSPVDKSKYTILIVGFPGYRFFDKEEYIVKSFDKSPYLVYLKPHPGKEDMSRYISLVESHSNSCKLILDQMFPDVDIVISYRSTLAIEYQAYNKKVLLYSDYTMEEISNYITEDSKNKFI